jgi:hypothetical protein
MSKETVKTKFSQAEARAIARFVEDVRELCDIDEDLDIEIGEDVARMYDILELNKDE